MARQDHAIGSYYQVELPPSTVTRLWMRLVVVRQHVGDLHLPPIALDRALGDLTRPLHLLATGHQSGAVLQSPSVILSVSQLDSIRTEIRGQVYDLSQSVEIGPVEDNVDREGETELPDDRRCCLLVSDGFDACNPLSNFGVRVLYGDLNVFQTGFLEPFSASPGQSQPRGNQRRVEAFASCMGRQFLQVLSQQRLPS